jgi:hypothetical protein
MPAVKSANPLDEKLAKRGLSTVTAANKNNEVDYGFGGDLPPGINGGVAKLSEIKTGEYKNGDKKGEPFVRFAGVVVSPQEFEGQRIEGNQASIMIPLCDDPPNARRGNKPGKTFADRIAQLLNEFKKLGAEALVAALPPNCKFSDYMAIADALVKAGPHFKFRTYAIKDKPTPQNPNPEPGQTQTEFKGICNYDTNSQTGDGVVDNSGSNAPAETSEAGQEEATDWAGLGELADNGDSDAAARIDAAAEQLGLTSREDWANLTYASAAAAVAEAEAGGGAEPPAEGGGAEAGGGESSTPKKGETWNYRPKHAKADVEVEITTVFDASQKANVKILSGPKAGTTVRSVPWSELK